MVVKVAISGAAGRMGRRLMALSVADPEVELVQALEYPEHPLMGKVRFCVLFETLIKIEESQMTCVFSQKVRDIEPEAQSDIVLTASLESGADVVIDFSSPQGTLALAKRAEELGIALVIGTTAKV